MYWMIHPTAEAEIRRIYAEPVPTAEQLAEQVTASEDLDIVDGVASIPIRGFLTTERSGFLSFFGVAHTTYGEIQSRVLEAEANPAVRKIEFQVDSGGGVVSNSLIAASNAIHSARKPTVAVVGDMAASAAYWLASQADEIVLSGSASMVGSIGVAVRRFVIDEVMDIASTDAPKKRPDAGTEQGRADIRKELDDIHELFVADVMRGRDVSASVVKEDFGQGGVLLAAEAVKVGMADRVIGTSAQPAQRDTVAAMDLKSLEDSDPGVYAECLALGAKKERSRAAAHLKLGKASGVMDAAIGYIEAGTAFLDDDVQATYAAANMQRVHAAQHAADEAPELNASPIRSEGDVADDNIRACLAKAGLKDMV